MSQKGKQPIEKEPLIPSLKEIETNLHLQDYNNDKPLEKIEDDSAYLDNIHKIRDYSSQQFEKQLVYLAGGGLVFTVGFVKNIVTITPETPTLFLISSWAAFTVALVCNLLSHMSSIHSMDLEILRESRKSDKWNKITHVLNRLSVISLISGIISFIIFVSKNL